VIFKKFLSIVSKLTNSILALHRRVWAGSRLCWNLQLKSYFLSRETHSGVFTL